MNNNMAEAKAQTSGQSDLTPPEPVGQSNAREFVNRDIQDPVNRVGEFKHKGSFARSLANFKANNGGVEANPEMVMLLAEAVLDLQNDTQKRDYRKLTDVDIAEITAALPKDKKLAKDPTGKYIIVDKNK